MINIPEIGPGNGFSLFEEIHSLGLWHKKKIKGESPLIMECDFESFQNIADALCMASPFILRPVKNPFSFLASSSLSGAGNPCSDPHCCFARAKALGRFAALYADTVLIRDPFGDILHEKDSAKLRLEFSLKLGILDLLRPEIEAGVVLFAPTHFPLCDDGLKKFNQVEDAIKEGILRANEQIINRLLEHLEVKVEGTDKYNYLSISGTENFVPHEGIDVVPINRRSQLLRSKRRQKLSKDDVREVIQTYILDPALIDLQYRHIINWLYDVRYITDRPVDADLLRAMGENVNLQLNQLSTKASHPLPFIDGLDTKTLLKLREEEGEAFQVYRDRVRTLVEQSTLSDLEFKEAFRDLVQPELNQIDKAVASVRKMVKREMREKLIFGTGMVTIGLAAGAVTPEIGAIVAAMSGAKFGSGLLSNINTLLSEPAKARENDFFYLWKARELGNRKNAEQGHTL
jgi:hypothetical protein